MRIQFLDDNSDFRSRSGGGYLAKHRKSGGLFWWTILITLLIGLAIFCWFFSIMVFKYPEKPFNHKLLTKLKKLEPITAFSPQRVPHGKFYNAKDILSRYYYFNAEQLRLTNEDLKRSYIRNYYEEAPVYMKGTFTVIQSRKLNKKDVISEGWVVRARSVDMNDVHVELLLPGADDKSEPFKKGDTFTLDNKVSFAAVLHVERTANDGVCATVVPIVYGEYAVNEDRRVSLEPPDTINVSSEWPLIPINESSAEDKVAAKSVAQ